MCLKHTMRILLYDDFNHAVRPPRVIGSIRQTFAALAFKNGWKIIEVYETEDIPNRQDMEVRG